MSLETSLGEKTLGEMSLLCFRGKGVRGTAVVPIFLQKNGVLLKNQFYDPIFTTISGIIKSHHFLAKIFLTS
jgi:hypothetical protein